MTALHEAIAPVLLDGPRCSDSSAAEVEATEQDGSASLHRRAARSMLCISLGGCQAALAAWSLAAADRTQGTPGSTRVPRSLAIPRSFFNQKSGRSRYKERYVRKPAICDRFFLLLLLADPRYQQQHR